MKKLLIRRLFYPIWDGSKYILNRIDDCILKFKQKLMATSMCYISSSLKPTWKIVARNLNKYGQLKAVMAANPFLSKGEVRI